VIAHKSNSELGPELLGGVILAVNGEKQS